MIGQKSVDQNLIARLNGCAAAYCFKPGIQLSHATCIDKKLIAFSTVHHFGVAGYYFYIRLFCRFISYNFV